MSSTGGTSTTKQNSPFIPRVSQNLRSIEDAVDCVLLKNKEKVDALCARPPGSIECLEKKDFFQNIGSDTQFRKPENKRRGGIYFVRKNQKNKKTLQEGAALKKLKVKKHLSFGKKPRPRPVKKEVYDSVFVQTPIKPLTPASSSDGDHSPPQTSKKGDGAVSPKQSKDNVSPSGSLPTKTQEKEQQTDPLQSTPAAESEEVTPSEVKKVDEQEIEWMDNRIKDSSAASPHAEKSSQKTLKKEKKIQKKLAKKTKEKHRDVSPSDIISSSSPLPIPSPQGVVNEPSFPVASRIQPTASFSLSNEEKTVFSQEVLQRKTVLLTQLGLSEKQWEELDFYPINEPFSYVEIIRDTQSLDKRYVLIEVELSEQESQVLRFIQDTLKVETIDTEEIDTRGIDEYLQDKVKQIVSEYKIELPASSMQKVMYFLEKSYVGLGTIDGLMRDPNIEDISCDGANVPIFLYHREYGSVKSNIEFKEEEELSGFVVRLAQKCGKHISISEPMLDATMPDGSRIQMTLSAEVTAKGSTFTIRKFREDPFSPPDLVEFNTMSAEMVAYMWMVVENGVNALIAGGTAAGKTSTLNALALFIPRDSKVVSIEETREINLPHPNWIPGVARSGFGEVVADKVVGEIDMYDLMKAALRQRPEYILVGEIRGKEAYVLFQAMATGHTTYSTAHADSAQSLIHRLEGKPIEIPRIMLQALDIVCIQVTTRVKNKRARRCKQIIEIIDIDPTTKEILTNEVFRWDPIEDTFIYSGKSYVLESIRVDKDMARDAMTQELKNRAELMQWMNQKNIRDFRQVAMVLAQYNESPVDLMKKVKENP